MKHDYRKEAVANSLSNRKNLARNASDIKRTYLFLYNLLMFVGFSFVVLVLVIKLSTNSLDQDSIKAITNIVKILTFTQLLETLHGFVGIVPGGPFLPFMQVSGRLLVNYFLTEDSIRQDSYPFAHTLMLVWSSIEIFRYSFYALRVFNVDVYAITWLRYSLFAPLYPMGGFSEAMILRSVARIYGKTNRFSYLLPNSSNIAFSLPTAISIYNYLILPLTIMHLMRYMFRQRSKQLKALREKLA